MRKSQVELSQAALEALRASRAGSSRPCRDWWDAPDLSGRLNGHSRDWLNVASSARPTLERDTNNLEPPQWPELDAEALHGIAGEIVMAARAAAHAGAQRLRIAHWRSRRPWRSRSSRRHAASP